MILISDDNFCPKYENSSKYELNCTKYESLIRKYIYCMWPVLSFSIEWFELRSEVFLRQLFVWKCLKSVMWLGSILFFNTLTMLTISHAEFGYMWILQTKYSPSQQMYQLILGMVVTFQTDFRPPDSLVWWAHPPYRGSSVTNPIGPSRLQVVMGVCAVWRC